jgi:hypothetical protein
MNAGVVNFLLLKEGSAAFLVMKGFGVFRCGLKELGFAVFVR